MKKLRPEITIDFTSDSVSTTVAALQHKEHPHFILSDIHLADGLSFQIWDEVPSQSPKKKKTPNKQKKKQHKKKNKKKKQI
ncbi:MAG: hypothetical protein AAFQ37_13360, partial [Bacteroidota bacterium]